MAPTRIRSLRNFFFILIYRGEARYALDGTGVEARTAADTFLIVYNGKIILYGNRRLGADLLTFTATNTSYLAIFLRIDALIAT